MLDYTSDLSGTLEEDEFQQRRRMYLGMVDNINMRFKVCSELFSESHRTQDVFDRSIMFLAYCEETHVYKEERRRKQHHC